MKSLLDVIKEAQEGAPSESDIAEARAAMKMEKTKIPPAIAAIKNHFLNSDEFELYEFLDNCEFWECKLGYHPPVWFATAGVRVSSKGYIEFAYDKAFIERISKRPGELAFLIAHEASHILRYHEDRRLQAKGEPSLWNTAGDMIINYDIAETAAIGGWKPIVPKEAMHIPDKFKKDYKEDKKAYYTENIYAWLNANPKEKEKAEGGGEPPEYDYFGEGSIVKVNSGPHKGEYRKITKVNDDKTYETEPVDIDAEIAKVRGS